MKEKLSEEVLQEFNKRTLKACEQVYTYYHLILAYFATRVLREEEVAKDIASEVLLNVIHSARIFEKETNLRAFLFISVKNQCLKQIAKDDIRKRHQRSIGRLEDMLASDIDESAEAEEVRSRLLFAIYEVMEELPPVRKKVFKMSYIDCLKADQIGKLLNMSREAVYTNRNKAIKDIKNRLKEKLILTLSFFII